VVLTHLMQCLQLMQAIYASLEDSYSPRAGPRAAGSAPRSGANSPSADSEGGPSAGSGQV